MKWIVYMKGGIKLGSASFSFWCLVKAPPINKNVVRSPSFLSFLRKVWKIPLSKNTFSFPAQGAINRGEIIFPYFFSQITKDISLTTLLKLYMNTYLIPFKTLSLWFDKKKMMFFAFPVGLLMTSYLCLTRWKV